MTKHTVQIVLNSADLPMAMDQKLQHSQEHIVVKANDEVRWLCSEGTVEIEFQKLTPFAPGVEVKGPEFHSVVAGPGQYRYHCTVTTHDGKKHGWPVAGGGGTVEVGSGSRTGST